MGSFDTNFLPTNTTFDPTFNLHFQEHNTFEGFANSKFLSIGKLQTPETPQNHSDPGHPLRNFSQEFDHSSWTINDIRPGDFDGHPLASRVDRNVESHTFQPRNYYRPARPKAEGLIYPKNLLIVLKGSTSSPADTIPKLNPYSGVQSSLAGSAGAIPCTRLSCEKVFTSTTAYNHHFKNHTKLFQCPIPNCTALHATKRHLDRHVNDRHCNTEKYYCPVKGCKRSILPIEPKPFSRSESCKGHMMKVHRLTEKQVKALGMGIDRETKRIREGRAKIERHMEMTS